MKFLVVLAVCIAGAFAAPNYGGYSAAPEIKITSYNTPAVKVAPVATYAAPAYSHAEVKSYAPLEVRKPIIPIVRFALDDHHDGNFNFDSESGDGTRIVEQGSLKNLGDVEGPVSVMSGSYSFIGDDSKTYTVTWTADERGFHATGDHLPTPPPIPAEILKSLSTDSYSSSDDGSYKPEIVKTVSSYGGYASAAPIAVKVNSGYGHY